MPILPISKPKVTARMALPDPAGRLKMADELIAIAAHIESKKDWVGFAIVGLLADGHRISAWNATKGATTQLAKQVRREAALIAEESRKPWE